jgi:hypothetical protein
VLYEDELHDNGTSQLIVRIRVTNNYFYVLQRVWIRVDGVIFRLLESRLLHRFSESHILRLLTSKEDTYDNVVKSCTPKQLRENVLDDANLISDKLKLTYEKTEKFTFSGADTHVPVQATSQDSNRTTSSETDNAKQIKDEIARQNAAAEAAFKKKFGNAKPNAAALMQRQRQHETRYFDSGDAFSSKEKGGAGVQAEEKLERLEVVAPSTAPAAAPADTEDAARKAEIAQQNAAAEAAFKKKFGNAKPNAAALMQRQRQHETRYFDSGDAFSSKDKGAS